MFLKPIKMAGKYTSVSPIYRPKKRKKAITLGEKFKINSSTMVIFNLSFFHFTISPDQNITVM